MSKHLRAHGKVNRIGRTPKRPGTKPRPLAIKIVATNPSTYSTPAFNATRAALVANLVQRLIDRGALVIQDGVIHVRER